MNNHSNHINQKNHSSDYSGLLRSARNDGAGICKAESLKINSVGHHPTNHSNQKNHKNQSSDKKSIK